MMRLLLGALLWLWCAAAEAAVAVDVTGTEVALSATTSVSYSGHWTIGSSLSNGAAVVALLYNTLGTTNATFTTPQLNGTGMTQIIQHNFSGNGIGVVLFGQIAPASGPATFTVTSSISADYYVYGVSFTGVDQTGGTTSFAHSAAADNAGTTCLANTITTANGNYTLQAASVGTGNSTSTMQVGTCGSGTAHQDWFDNSSPTGQAASAGKVASTSASTAWIVINSSSDNAFTVGVDIVAAAGGGPTCPMTRALMGVGC